MDFSVVLITMGAAFVLSVVLFPLMIPLLRRLKFGQQIRAEGPAGHQKKKGTPTMGGIVILLTMAIAFYRFAGTGREFYVLFVAALGFGFVGFLDDYIKIVFKRSLGLTARQKLLGQFIVSGVVCWMLASIGHDTSVYFSPLRFSLDLSWFYYPFLIVFMLGFSNAVNFTDGLDGLLSGTSAIAFGALCIIAMYRTEPETAVFSAAMIGALLGFLVFNAHPAKVFMGDTGSLAIGGGLAAAAALTKTELMLVVIGGVFVVEILSVVLQVISFKTRGKRIFKMSPLHHHFELSGWSEWRIVVTFWAAGLLLAAAGILLNEGF